MRKSYLHVVHMSMRWCEPPDGAMGGEYLRDIAQARERSDGASNGSRSVYCPTPLPKSVRTDSGVCVKVENGGAELSREPPEDWKKFEISWADRSTLEQTNPCNAPAPAAITAPVLSDVMPPIASTGIVVASATSRSRSTPIGILPGVSKTGQRQRSQPLPPRLAGLRQESG